MIVKAGVPGPFGTYDLVNLRYVELISVCSKTGYDHYKHILGDHILMAWSAGSEAGSALYIGSLEDCTIIQDSIENSLIDNVQMHACGQSVALDGTT